MIELRQVLPPDPASASAARRFTTEALRSWDKGALTEVATLLVSELVTNSLLHADSEIALRLLFSGAGVRVEVQDGSPLLPMRRSYGQEATTGRGLGLVELLAGSWGIEPQADGKVVWFEVGTGQPQRGEADLLEALVGLPEARYDPEDSGPRTRVEVSLLGLPVQLYRVMEQHNDALLREFTLMTLDLGATATTATAPRARLPVDVAAIEERLQGAAQAGDVVADLVLQVPLEARQAGAELLTALDEADELSRRGDLLIPAALPEIRACRQWYLGEIIAQVDGAQATPWSAPEASRDAGPPLLAQIEHGLILEKLNDAIIVGDDENRILYVNPAAERLLGWSRRDLEGQRLTVIVPAHLREAHVVGYTRHLVTGEQRLVGRPVRVPARHRDGREVPVELLLSAFRVPSGRQVFVGALRDLTDAVRREHDVGMASALRATSDVAALLGRLRGAAELRVVAAEVLATIGERLGWQVGAVWTIEAATTELTCLQAWNDGSKSSRAFEVGMREWRFPAGAGLPGRVWTSGEPEWIVDVVSDANFPRTALALAHGLRSAFAFPIVSGGDVRGVVEFLSAEILDTDPELLAILATVGLHLSLYAQPG